MVIVFASDLGDQGLEMVFNASLLNTHHYKVRVKCKWNDSEKEVELSPTPWSRCYQQ